MLARTLGRTVKETKRDMGMGEFASWLAYYRLDPWGEDRGDLRAGIVASTIANVHAGRRGKPFTARDFMPEYGKAAASKKPQTWQEMHATMARFGEAHNARIAGRAKVKVPNG